MHQKEKNGTLKFYGNVRIIKDFEKLSCRVFVHIKDLVFTSTQNIVIYPT